MPEPESNINIIIHSGKNDFSMILQIDRMAVIWVYLF